MVATPLRLGAHNLSDHLRNRGLITPGEKIRIEPAGDGNINWVRRVRRPDGASLIVKQARAALERFPEYRVTTDRMLFEARWLERARPCDEAAVLPRVLDFDREARALALEDLGAAERLDHALARGADVRAPAAALASFLGRVHATTRDPALAAEFANDEMRRLHGEHIFVLPFRPNDFPLPEPLSARAAALHADAGLRELADAAWAHYLEPRGSLLHGDVQAGNVLLAARGPVLLDAEIAHVGDPAFDLGTLVAHLALSAVAEGVAERALPALRAAVEGHANAFAKAAPGARAPGFEAVSRVAGFEMLRRTIGAARVAAVAETRAALRVLERAEAWIRRPPARVEALLAG